MQVQTQIMHQNLAIILQQWCCGKISFAVLVPDLILVRDELVVKDDLRDVVVERAHLESAHLHVQRKGVERHRADERDPVE